MTEPCAVYSTRSRPFSADEIRTLAAGATVEANGSDVSWTQLKIEWPHCQMTITASPDAGLAEHLDGFRGYLWHCAQKMTQSLYAVL